MKSLWQEADARAAIQQYRGKGINEARALALYASQLIGQEAALVLHGGGNSSVKTQVPDLAGRLVEVLCVKGSGHDMAQLEPEGMPAVELAPLRALASLNALGDEAMMHSLRRACLDPSGPAPSVETLLHAFIPERFILHTHANAFLAISNRPDGAERCREAFEKQFGDSIAHIPYVMPGFRLAVEAAHAFRQHPATEALLLLNHGVVTVGATAQEAYARMIAVADSAERYLSGERSANSRAAACHTSRQSHSTASGSTTASAARSPEAVDDVQAAFVAPVLRGLLSKALGDARRLIVTHRSTPAIKAFCASSGAHRWSETGPITPDHVIRLKPWPLLLPALSAAGIAVPDWGAPGAPEAADSTELEIFSQSARAALADYGARYVAYCERHAARADRHVTQLDPVPRVLLIPGLGLFAAGESLAAAELAADLAEANVQVIHAAVQAGDYCPISEADLFDMEYWELEQAKVGRRAAAPFAGQIVAITGGAGTLGRATARAFAEQGAAVALVDLPGESLSAASRELNALAVACDVTDADSINAAFATVCTALGGLDCVVSNAGAVWQGTIGDVSRDILERSFELNFWAHQYISQAALKIFRAQGLGGCLLYNASKQAMNPGKNMGPYGLPKNATVALARQYALDHGAEGIRANVVNADRIRSGLLNDALIASRSESRGVTEQTYMSGNLLQREVTAEDVAHAFVMLARAEASTAAVLTVDGGNIAAAVR